MVTEDYVEVIGDLVDIYGEARITDIARCRGVSHPTAVKAMARLKRAGLVMSRPYRAVFLTEEGKRLAERVRTRHLVVVKVLLAIGVPKEVAENDAEGIEYHVSDISLAAFEKFLCRTD
jgi:DtxR family transcriptional regulator, manganese transport regulator